MTSIIILSYNTIDYLQMCIESIRGFTEEGSYELIVVDNASTDGSSQWIAQQPDIRAIFNTENKGFPGGCNQGLAIAKGDDLLLLNSDVIVTPRWLEQLKKALYSSKDVGAVSCVTNKCSNGQQIEMPYKEFDINQMLDFAEKHNHSNPQLWTMHFTLVGFCYLFKREIYDAIGGLDEAFFPGNYEDDDYSFRINLLGYKTLLCRDTFIHHFGSSSFIKKRTPEEELEYTQRLRTLLIKNGGHFCKKWSVRDYYKNTSPQLFSICKQLESASSLLVVGHNRLGYIYYISVFAQLYGKQIKICYVTDSKIDGELAGKWFEIHCFDNINKSISTAINNNCFDAIMLTRSFNDDVYNDLKCTLKKVSYRTQLLIEEQCQVICCTKGIQS